ncbi:MAG: hypothetical protein ACLTKQ_08020 [Acutalibacteraceae bacterium]
MQCGFLTGVAKFFTAFGDENFTIPIVVLSVVLCFFKRTRKYGFSILFAVIIGTLITNVIAKPMVLRIRPYTCSRTRIGPGDHTALSGGEYSFLPTPPLPRGGVAKGENCNRSRHTSALRTSGASAFCCKSTVDPQPH